MMLWDPAKHPRDLRGRFSQVLKDLKKGQSVELPDGVSVKRTDQGFRVHNPHQKINSSVPIADAHRAADDALHLSARNTHEKSLGGKRKFDTLPDALKAHRATARRQQKRDASKEATGKRLGRDKAATEQKAADEAKHASGAEGRLQRKAVRRAITQRLATGKGNSDHRWKLKSADEKLRLGKMPSSFSLEERKAVAEAVQGHGGRRAHDALGIPKSKGKKAGEPSKKTEAGKIPRMEREQLPNGRYRYTENGKQVISKSRVKYTHFSRHALTEGGYEGRYVHLYHKSEGAAKRGKYKYGDRVHVGKIERSSGGQGLAVGDRVTHKESGMKGEVTRAGLKAPSAGDAAQVRVKWENGSTSREFERRLESTQPVSKGAKSKDVPTKSRTQPKGPAPKKEPTGKVKASAPSQQRMDAALHRVNVAITTSPSGAASREHLFKVRSALRSGNHTIAASYLLKAHHVSNHDQTQNHIDTALNYLGYRRKKKAAA